MEIVWERQQSFQEMRLLLSGAMSKKRQHFAILSGAHQEQG